ncbi:MAG: aminotransferase class V-fold PLP-dependent enzyme [Candidatus Thermoplasmatota archaeon]|nr:aminotransferase class V-fold PLP-dependent enzyme [Candidatus Thermoplasmatota archaeon]
MSVNPERLKKDFPIFSNNPDLIYLDNAATTQKPSSVIRAVSDYYATINSNVHRGVYKISEEATEMYEGSRKKVSEFIGAREPAEIVFLRNTTEAINLLSYTLGRKLKKGDEVLLTEMEHHSNLVPWYFLREAGIVIKFAKMKADFTLDYEDFQDKLNTRTVIASFTEVSNVLGTINDVRELSNMCRENSTISIVDAAQSVPHMSVDVRAIGCDFLAFSGHKMLAPAGIGVLYGRKDLLDRMHPFLGGGEMIGEVDYNGATYADVPWKFEAGTQNVEGAVGLSAAIDYLKSIGMDSVREHERSMIDHIFKIMDTIGDLRQFGPMDSGKRGGVFSFNIGDVKPFDLLNQSNTKFAISHSIHPHDLAAFLDRNNIAVRSGHHCAMPLMGRMGVSSTARVSPYIYNDERELDLFFDALSNCRKEMAR